MSTYSKFYFRPAKGEQVTTELTPENDEYSAVFGRVTDSRGAAMQGALVLLLRVTEGEPPSLLSRFVTDDDGHFMFGPLEGGILYQIKVYKDSLKLRELEIQMD